jgi:hypothetical protein
MVKVIKDTEGNLKRVLFDLGGITKFRRDLEYMRRRVEVDESCDGVIVRFEDGKAEVFPATPKLKVKFGISDALGRE